MLRRNDIPGYEGLYQVDSEGQVWSCRRTGKWRKLNPVLGERGYLTVTLCLDTKKQIPVHRLVLLAFRGPAPLGTEGRHLNSNRQDNRLKNLKWGTREENQADRILAGTSNRKLNVTVVEEIRRLYATGRYTYESLKKKFRIKTIQHILDGTCWKDIPC